MIYTPIASKKKRNLVATPGEPHTAAAPPLDAAAYLRSVRIEAMAQFAPLLAGAAVLSAIVVAWIMAGQESALPLIGWVTLVIACSWLVVRRLEANGLVYLRCDPPQKILIETGGMIGLLAGLWISMPIATYAHQPDDIQTVLAGAICAMMTGALAIATAPFAAIIWAGVLAAGLGIAFHLGGDRLSMPMMVLLLFHFGFILMVIRRIALLSTSQAERAARQSGEIEATTRLMREYEERGTNCLWQTDTNHMLTYATPGISVLLARPMTRLMGTPLPALIGGNAEVGSTGHRNVI